MELERGPKKRNHPALTADPRLFLTKIACGLIATLIVPSAGCRKELTPQEEEGKHLYSIRCAHCHEDNDLGLKKTPPDLHHLFDRSTLPSGAPAKDSEIGKVILAGKGMMPSFSGRFTKEQLDALLAYLHTGLR